MPTISVADIEKAVKKILSPDQSSWVVFEWLDLLGLGFNAPNLQEYLKAFSRGYTNAIQAAIRQLFQLIEEKGTDITWKQVAAHLAVVEHDPQTIPLVFTLCGWEDYLCRWFFADGWDRGHG